MIATGAPVCLDRSGGGNRPHFVFMAVGPDLQPALNRQRPARLRPT